MPANQVLIFVYGSLRTGEYNNDLLIRSTKLCDASIRGFDLYSLGVYPAIIPSSDLNHLVYGEVFRADPGEFLRIDRMELGAGYKAVQVEALHDTNDLDEHGEASFPLTYVFEDPKWLQDMGELVRGGDWSKRAKM